MWTALTIAVYAERSRLLPRVAGARGAMQAVLRLGAVSRTRARGPVLKHLGIAVIAIAIAGAAAAAATPGAGAVAAAMR